jgi:CheY-like chemotaxis protein
MDLAGGKKQLTQKCEIHYIWVDFSRVPSYIPLLKKEYTISEVQKPRLIEGSQKRLIDDWLRQADKYIHAGRYLAADELLQKVLNVHPENEIAISYLDRIQFLVKQLSTRVGLNKETQLEVRKFRDLQIGRKGNQINSMLVTAQKMIEDGHLKKAHEQTSRALGLDSDNSYAKALLQRINELEKAYGSSTEFENEIQFRKILTEAWKEGVPARTEGEQLSTTQSRFKISDKRRSELEREIKNSWYKESLRDLWLAGGLASFNMDLVEKLRSKFDISRLDHSFIESSLLKEVRKNKVRGTILVVDPDDASLLTLSQILRSHHYAVIAATTIDEALASVKEVTPDVILSEVKFGDGSLGFELFEFIRATPATQRAPFIFLNSSLDRTSLLIGKRLGVDDVLPKPVDGELLVATITGALLRRTVKLPSTKQKQATFS